MKDLDLDFEVSLPADDEIIWCDSEDWVDLNDIEESYNIETESFINVEDDPIGHKAWLDSLDVDYIEYEQMLVDLELSDLPF